MNFCLSDLVPPLRWSDAATIPLLRDRPGLPEAWWRSLPMARVLTVLGPEGLAEILAGIALEHWPAAAVGDILPALYVLDPEEADEPCTAIALDRTGSWPGLLALTGHELRDQPFIQPVPVLNALFTAVFSRIAHLASGAPYAPVPDPKAEARISEVPAVSAVPDSTAEARASKAPGGSGDEPSKAVGTAAGSASEEPESTPEEAAAEIPSGDRPQALPEAASGPVSRSVSEPVSEPVSEEAAEEISPAAPAEDDAEDDPAGQAAPPGESGAVPELSAAEPASAEPSAAAGAAGPEPVSAEHASSEAADPEAPPAPEAVPGLEAGMEAVPGPEAGGAAAPEPHAGGGAEQPEPHAAEAGAGRDDRQARRPAGSLHALLDGVFAGLDDKSWAVAQNRVFSDTPAAVEALSKLFAVQPEVIDEAEADLRRRLGEWLASGEAAPYREHLARVRKILGKAAPKARLIAAAPWHARELRSLDVPAWQFVLATLPGYHLVDEWLIEGDITELRHRTRDVISGAKPPLTMTKALDLVASLGIHPEVSKEWLENVPQLRILGGGQRAPRRADNADNAEAGAAASGSGEGGSGASSPPGARDEAAGATGGEPEPKPAAGPFRPLKDVSLTRRCFRQPDGRWWLRIDITTEHVQGAECPLPTGFAAYLGMAPGMARKVHSAVGEVGLSWQDRPVLESLRTLLEDAGAKQGSHLFLTLSDEGVLRARHLPAAASEVEPIARALRLVGYTAPGGTPEQAGRVIATRVGMTGQVSLPDLLARLRERGDRDLLSLLA